MKDPYCTYLLNDNEEKVKKKLKIVLILTLKNAMKNGILLPKLFWPTVRKNCSSDCEKLLKFKAEGSEFANILRPLEQFVQTVKG